jgi:hypothetical protein
VPPKKGFFTRASRSAPQRGVRYCFQAAALARDRALGARLAAARASDICSSSARDELPERSLRSSRPSTKLQNLPLADATPRARPASSIHPPR